MSFLFWNAGGKDSPTHCYVQCIVAKSIEDVVVSIATAHGRNIINRWQVHSVVHWASSNAHKTRLALRICIPCGMWIVYKSVNMRMKLPATYDNILTQLKGTNIQPTDVYFCAYTGDKIYFNFFFCSFSVLVLLRCSAVFPCIWDGHTINPFTTFPKHISFFILFCCQLCVRFIHIAVSRWRISIVVGSTVTAVVAIAGSAM